MLNSRQIYQLLHDITDMYEENKQELSRLDGLVGDGDHGFSIARGCQAGLKAVRNLGDGAQAREYLKIYGRELTNEVGGAMGPLFGLLFTELGRAAKADSACLGLAELAAGLDSALAIICQLGGAAAGDKTMVDSMIPTVKSLKRSVREGRSFLDGLERAALEAEKGVQDTVAMVARRGRAKYVRERSKGVPDAGATSFYYLVRKVRDFADKEGQQ